jgi:hypothetical protein
MPKNVATNVAHSGERGRDAPATAGGTPALRSEAEEFFGVKGEAPVFVAPASRRLSGGRPAHRGANRGAAYAGEGARATRPKQPHFPPQAVSSGVTISCLLFPVFAVTISGRMDKFVIRGGNPLLGTIRVSG